MVPLCRGTRISFLINTPVKRKDTYLVIHLTIYHNLLQFQEIAAAKETSHAIVSLSPRANELIMDDTATEQAD
jgi:hypothetical protein